MIGNTNAMRAIGGDHGAYRMYVPLQFWFNRNNGLALPLIALQYHDVRMTIKFRDAAQCVNHTGAVVNGPEMKDATLLIDYIYLDTEERKDSHKPNTNTLLNNYNSLAPNLFCQNKQIQT